MGRTGGTHEVQAAARVPLSERALALLQDARCLHPNSELLFPGAHEDTALSDMSLTKIVRDMGLADSTTVHGFRSAFRDRVTEIAKAREVVAEAALAHAVKDKTEAAYRRAPYLKERRELMEKWAWFVGNSNINLEPVSIVDRPYQTRGAGQESAPPQVWAT